jgi:translocation and assembly module TamA
MKHNWIVGIVILGLGQSAMAAFFQQNSKAEAAKKESPIKVNFHGGDAALQENLKAFMPPMRGLQCNASQARIQRLVEAAEPKLQQGAEAMGYYDARFTVTPSMQNNCWVLDIGVQSGLPIMVSTVAVQIDGEGRNLKEFRELLAKPPYQPGEVLIQQKYEDYKTSLGRTASNLGFFEAEYLTKEVKIDPDLRQAWITLNFNTGRRYKVGTVSVAQTVLDAKHLKRFIRVNQGDYYDVDAIRKQRGLLDKSGYYRNVDVLPQLKDAKDGVVPVTIDTDRCKRYRYVWALGYGANGRDATDGNSASGTECGPAIVTEQNESAISFASDNGFRTTMRMDIRWVNKKGHKFVSRLRLGQNKSAIDFVYRVPLHNPEHEYVDGTLSLEKMDANGVKVNGVNTSINYNRRTDTDWQQKMYVKYVDESITVDNVKDNTYLTLAGIRVKKTKKDDDLYPTKDWRLEAQLQGSVKNVLSSQSLLQAEVTAKKLHTFENKDKLILQGKAGASFTNDLNGIPVSLRYFAGGQNSVRGFDTDSLGETSASGAVIGGKHLLTTSVEYEHPIKDKWSGAAFIDAGDAFDTKPRVNAGIGAGVRYKSPIGPIRADIASPTDDLKNVHFYFSLGPDL